MRAAVLLRMKRLNPIAMCLILSVSLMWFAGGSFALAATDVSSSTGVGLVRQSSQAQLSPDADALTMLIGIGDSLTHGTMDATNNYTNTLNAYLQKVAVALKTVMPLSFSQPLFDNNGQRPPPYIVPTNLGVDGADVFTLEGLEYHKRVGADEDVVSERYLADKTFPTEFKDKSDQVLYPINLFAQQDVSQIDSAEWLIEKGAPVIGVDKAAVVLWIGNNDSSLAALGLGGSKPLYFSIPLDIVKKELKFLLRLLISFGLFTENISLEPYSQASIERNLTDLSHFDAQYKRVVDRLEAASARSGVETDIFLLTLPYFSAVGYLFDSEDLEFYLNKLNPFYRVPASFQRVADRGEKIANPLRGDRVSLLTFAMMYALMSTGCNGTGRSTAVINEALEIDGKQRDGLVMSEEEQQLIMARIDAYNEVIRNIAATRPGVHLVDIGQEINDAFTGKTELVVDGNVFTRKWMRGGGFTFDGVHPSYSGQAFVANLVLERMNEVMGAGAALYDLSDVFAGDPYFDHDGDGWAPGPSAQGSTTGELFFMFKDPDDSDASVGAVIPPDVWDRISDLILGGVRVQDNLALTTEAQRLGLLPSE